MLHTFTHGLPQSAEAVMEFGKVPKGSHVIIDEVLVVHVEDKFWAGDQIDMAKLKAIGRLGGNLYCLTTNMFEMHRS